MYHNKEETEEQRQVKNKRTLYAYMICLLVMGSAILIVYNYQNETSYIDPVTKDPVKWNHPFF
jgi:hypothetical protein